MENEKNKALLERIAELEKSLESLEKRSGLLSEELKSIKSNVEAIKSEAGAGVNTAASETGPEIITQEIAVPSEVSITTATKTIAKANPKKAKTKKEKNVSLEQFIGRNAMGIGASVLVFIAMIMFATLLMPYMGQEVKCAAMYVFSFILIGLGEWVYRKQKNGYLILSACGAGVLYISIVATHVYFRFIDMIPLYVLLLLWMVYVSYLGKKRSLIFVIVGQIGIAMSILMSAYGIDTALYLYLRFAFVLIAEGMYYIVFLKSKYNFKLTNTIGIMVAFFAFDSVVFSKYLNYSYSANRPGLTVVLLTLAITALAACRLISASDNLKQLNTSAVVSLVNGIFVLLTCSSLKDATGNLGMLLNMENAPLLMQSAWCYLPLTIYLAAVIAAIVRNGKKGKYNSGVLACIAFGAFLLSILLLPHQICPVLYAAILLALVAYNAHADRNELYLLSQAVVCLGMTVTEKGSGLFSSLFILVLSLAQMAYSRTLNPRRRFMPYEIISYLTTIGYLFVLAPVALEKFRVDDKFISFIVQTVLIICVQLAAKRFNWMYNKENKLSVFYFANLFFMIISAWGISYSEGVVQIIIATLLTAVIFSINLRSLLTITEKYGAYIAAKYSVLIGVFMYHLNVSSYVYSIVYLIISIICVVAGFKISNKSVRLYGLILSMLSIAKLILIDISYSNTLMRAFSFLICGLLCFGISLIYNHIDKQQKAKELQQEYALNNPEIENRGDAINNGDI